MVLVDNRIHTGATMLIAIRALRKLNVGSIVVAVPVGNALVRSVIEEKVDRIVCFAWSENFGHVGMWYQHLVRPNRYIACGNRNSCEPLKNTEKRSIPFSSCASLGRDSTPTSVRSIGFGALT